MNEANIEEELINIIQNLSPAGQLKAFAFIKGLMKNDINLKN